jgi:hypothetical protein
MIFTNNICNICKKEIFYDEIKDGEKNCVVCPVSHRCHKVCFSGAKLVECPVCESKDMKFCTRAKEAFLASQSTQLIGGKRKTNKKRNKSKRRKSKSKRVNKYK